MNYSIDRRPAGAGFAYTSDTNHAMQNRSGSSTGLVRPVNVATSTEFGKQNAIISGYIGHFNLSHVMQIVSTESKTGLLYLEHTTTTAYIGFEQGLICSVVYNNRDFTHTFIRYLRYASIISRKDLDTMRKNGIISSDILDQLVAKNIISFPRLSELAQIWLEDVVCELVGWQEGAYRFELREHIDNHSTMNIRVPIEPIVMESARRSDELQYMRESLDADAVFVCHTPPLKYPLPSDLPLTDYASYIASYLNGTTPVHSLLNAPFCCEYRVYDTLLSSERRCLVSALDRKFSSVINAAHRRKPPKKNTWKRTILPGIIAIILGATGFFAIRNKIPQLYLSFERVSEQSTEPSSKMSFTSGTDQAPSAIFTKKNEEKPKPPSKKTQQSVTRVEITNESFEESNSLSDTTPENSAITPNDSSLELDNDAIPSENNTPPIGTIPPENILAEMGTALSHHNYSRVLQLYEHLPEPHNNAPWALVCKMRSLIAEDDRATLRVFFKNHHLDDGEFLLAKTRILVADKHYNRALATARLASTNPCLFAPADEIKKEALYSIACILSAMQTSGMEIKKETVLNAWFDVKYAFRSSPSSRQITEANQKIRELSK